MYDQPRQHIQKQRHYSANKGPSSQNFGFSSGHVWMCCCLVIVLSDSFVTPWTAACQAPLSVGFFQARILEWVAIPCSRGYSRPRDQTCISWVSCISRWILYHWAKKPEARFYLQVFVLAISSAKEALPSQWQTTAQISSQWCLPHQHRQALAYQIDWF